MENQQEQSLLQMNLDYDGGPILLETVKWSRFLSIVGIIGIALAALAFALAGTALITLFATLTSSFANFAALGTAIVVLVLLLLFASLAYMIFMLYRFSVLIRRGINGQDQAAFTEGMKCLKVYFIFSGVYAILGLLGNIYSLISLFH